VIPLPQWCERWCALVHRELPAAFAFYRLSPARRHKNLRSGKITQIEQITWAQIATIPTNKVSEVKAAAS
jgi:hypothetical protein